MEEIKTKLKDIKLKSFAGENVVLASEEILSLCARLDNTGAFDQEPLCSICRVFENSSERQLQDWAHRVYRDCTKQVKSLRFNNDLALFKSKPPSPDDFITYDSLCTEAKQEYRELIASNRYGPASKPGKNDSVAFQAAVNNAVTSALKASGLTPKNDNTNNNNTNNSNGSFQGKCNYCKKIGHKINDCNEKKKDEAANKPPPNGSSNSTNTNQSSWTSIPPAPETDAATATQVRYGKTYK